MTQTPRKAAVHKKTGKEVMDMGVETTPMVKKTRPPVTPAALKVAELKAELQSRGLSPAGLKKDLVERLEEAIKNEAETHKGQEIKDGDDLKVEHDGEDETEHEEAQREEDEDMVGHKDVDDGGKIESGGEDESMQGKDGQGDIVNYEQSSPFEEVKKRPAQEDLPAAKIAKAENLLAPVPLLHITGFVRPLLVQHVQEMLSEFGQFEEFWMDGIKSHCFVQFADQAAVDKCKAGLQGMVWPQGTGRALSVGESSAGEMEQAKAREAEKKLGPDDLFLKTEFKPTLYYLPATGRPAN